jgi:hypothetical protein
MSFKRFLSGLRESFMSRGLKGLGKGLQGKTPYAENIEGICDALKQLEQEQEHREIGVDKAKSACDKHLSP